MDPIDAGTDNGFTFTAPNWPTDPQGEAYRITAQYPAHPAGSFFYPYLKRLPPIATFQFIKVGSYVIAQQDLIVIFRLKNTNYLKCSIIPRMIKSTRCSRWNI